MGSRSLPTTPLGSRTPRHSGPGSPAAALSSPGSDLRLHQMIAVQGRVSLYRFRISVSQLWFRNCHSTAPCDKILLRLRDSPLDMGINQATQGELFLRLCKLCLSSVYPMSSIHKTLIAWEQESNDSEIPSLLLLP